MDQRNQQELDAQSLARSKLIQIFRYLQALNQWRNPPQREISDSTLVCWFHDLPTHPCIVHGRLGSTENHSDDDFVLKVIRPQRKDAPPPPGELTSWIQEGWQNVDGRPSVKTSIIDTNGRTTRFTDDPRREELFRVWKSRYEQWVETERPARQALALYEKLYQLYAELEREGERIELILGDGRLRWQTSSGTYIDYPLLHRRLQLQFLPELPAFILKEAEQLSELYTASLQGVPEINATAIGNCREVLAQENWHPLGGEDTTNFFKRLVSLLHPYGQFNKQAFTEQTRIPQIIRDPVIFCRPRNIGISTALESILEDLPKRQKLPYALTSLISNDVTNTNERQEASSSRLFLTSPNGEDETILLSKPANAEQLEVARLLDQYGAVLVQGPPGTGKTHTIANLIGYLLAQGKRVLVTSEKSKALRVLREKVVEPLQPLCVSLLDDDSRQHMISTIDAISERLSRENPDRLEREAAQITHQRKEILQHLNQARGELIEARGAEYRPITIAGTNHPPSEAARYISQTREKNGWIPEPVSRGAALPLTQGELITLYTTNKSITPQEERDINLLLPEPESLLPPLDFEQRLREQAQLHGERVQYRRDLWFSEHVDAPPESLYALQKQLVQEIEPIKELTGWNMAAITAGREGGRRRQIWEDLIQEIRHTYQLAEQTQWYTIKYAPVIPIDCLPDRIDKVLDEMISYLKKGGKLGGFKLLGKRDWKIVLENATVKGKTPESLEDFQALYHLVQLYSRRRDLLDRWQRQMVPLGGADINQLGPEPERIIYQFIAPLQNRLAWFTQTWTPLEAALKQQGFQWEAFLAETPPVLAEYSEILRLRTAVIEKLPAIIEAEVQRRKIKYVDNELQVLQRNLERVGGNSNQAEVVQRLHYAIKNRDSTVYQQAYNDLVTLHAKRANAKQRHMLLEKLEKQAPAWAHAIRARSGIHGRQELPGDVEDAWLWRQLSDELERRTKISLTELQEHIVRLNNELFQVTANLVEKKAWAQQIRHTTLEQQRALQGWRELMKKVGKGTGKRTPRLITEAQKLIPTCQSAVPVWIMPLNAVARTFDMQRNHFDVIIIDEASQADITALFVTYMGDQIVIVGDDEQVSPTAVGQQIDTINQLIDEHLRGIPLANLYDGKLSIYNMARPTFKHVCLLEHFRCVSPIIKFSNDLSYQGKIKSLRDDSEVHRRPPTIAYAVKNSEKSEKINTAECNTIVSLLIAATQQPEYKDATFGVISMVGSEQAMRIDNLLQQYMTPQDYVRRRILCGDPPQFQGDERDVIFISMVDVAVNGPLTLRNEDANEYMWKKRFNVAASRARDQLWVVHSLDPELDLKSGDIRRKLIIHARDQHLHLSAQTSQEQRTESEFEKQVLQRLIRAGYRATTQWPVGAYRIDMVVEGDNKRLAIECDGDRWHPQEKLEEDMARQAILERLGWRFVRIRGSQFFRDPNLAMQPVFERLQALEIPAVGMATERLDNLDGKELKERIIRQADELRHQWHLSENTSTFTYSTSASSGTGSTIQAHTSTATKVSKESPQTSEKISAETQVRPGRTFLRSQVDKPSSPIAPTQSDKVRPPEALTAPQMRITHQVVGKATQESFNIISFFKARKLKVIDKRLEGRGIWVEGGNELMPIMKLLAEKGYHFKQIPGGLGPTIDGWYLK